MSLRTVSRALVVCVCGVGASSGACAGGVRMEPPPASHDDIAGKPALVADASGLKRTEVVADLEHAMVEGKSIIWCSTMKMAWDELAAVLGPPVQVSGSGTAPGGAAMAAALNASASGKGDLDAASCVALGGFGKDGILEKIKAELQEKFKGAASPKLLPAKVDPETIVAYSYLFKNLEFATPFAKKPEPLPFWESAGKVGGKGMAAFGVWKDHRINNWSELAKQVSILKYDSPTDWTVELKTKATGDRLIIARREKGKTLGETVASALSVPEGATPGEMDPEDSLMVPQLNFDLTRGYDELLGMVVQGSKKTGAISKAVQNIRFRLDERGAVLKSEAILVAPTAAPVRKRDREMICNGPFLIVMMRADAARPYFAVWVENPEVLVDAGK